jgi:hypothetical protein
LPTNRRIVDEDGIDFYPTPTWCVEALLDNEKFAIKNGGNNAMVWEPACGDGAISEVLIKNGYSVFSSDIIDHGYNKLDVLEDFLNWPLDDNCCADIITNPPYHIANDFVLKALELKPNKIAFLMRLAFLEGQERHESIFSVHPPARVLVFSERITMYKKYAADKSGSGTTAYAWFIWDQSHTGPTEIKWLNGYKPKKQKASKK